MVHSGTPLASTMPNAGQCSVRYGALVWGLQGLQLNSQLAFDPSCCSCTLSAATATTTTVTYPYPTTYCCTRTRACCTRICTRDTYKLPAALSLSPFPFCTSPSCLYISFHGPIDCSCTASPTQRQLSPAQPTSQLASQPASQPVHTAPTRPREALDSLVGFHFGRLRHG